MPSTPKREALRQLRIALSDSEWHAVTPLLARVASLAHCSPTTVRRASRQLAVEVDCQHFAGSWWRLP